MGRTRVDWQVQKFPTGPRFRQNLYSYSDLMSKKRRSGKRYPSRNLRFHLRFFEFVGASTRRHPVGAADFNAYGSCRPPRIWLLGSVWILSVLCLDSVWGSFLAPSWLCPGSILAPLADQSRAGPEQGRSQNHGFWTILAAPF